MNRPARLAVSVISAGRVGAVLGAALRGAGHQVVAASGVSTESVRRAETLLPGAPMLPPDEAAVVADLVLLAIPDDVLAGTIRGLVATGSLREGQIVVHTSGAYGIDVLAPATEIGALGLALHPAMTFTGRAEDIEKLASCCFGVTAQEHDEAAWHVAEALVVEMGGEPVRVPEQARPRYHAAMVHGANHLMTLVNDAVALLRSGGVDEPERVLAPLLSAALDNSLRFGDRALTGPVARGDADTVAKHLEVLADEDVLASYRAMARRTADRAEAARLLDDHRAAEVRKLLEDS